MKYSKGTIARVVDNKSHHEFSEGDLVRLYPEEVGYRAELASKLPCTLKQHHNCSCWWVYNYDIVLEQRPIKELLELMLKQFRNLKTRIFNPLSGLCSCISRLNEANAITTGEYTVLSKYMDQFRPKESSYKLGGYWWKKGRYRPRIKWLKQQISKL